MSFRPSPTPDELPATIGRYEILRLLGEGSMGRVLLAYDPVLQRQVAVKHLRDDLKIPRDVRQGLLTRMRHEARAAARVAHPHLVVLHDMGEDDSIGLYLVFEYVEGLTLKQRIAEGPLPPAEVARLARDLGAALTLAHDAGILHRDVKPENLILSKSGGKIADFGIARIPDSTLTHQGGLMGTPAYSAPETFRSGKFSPQSDQFSLGASLYEALSGRRAFPGDDAVAVAARITHEEAEPVAGELGLPTAVDAVFARALAKRAEDRYATCAALGVALAESLEAAGVTRSFGSSAPAQSPVETALPALAPDRAPVAPPPEERKASQVILGAAVIVATAALLVRALLHSKDGEKPEVTAPVAGAVSAMPSAARVRGPLPATSRAGGRVRAEPAGGGSGAPAGSAGAPADAGAATVVPGAVGVGPASAAAPEGSSPPVLSGSIKSDGGAP